MWLYISLILKILCPPEPLFQYPLCMCSKHKECLDSTRHLGRRLGWQHRDWPDDKAGVASIGTAADVASSRWARIYYAEDIRKSLGPEGYFLRCHVCRVNFARKILREKKGT